MYLLDAILTLFAPIRVNERVSIAAVSTITEDIPSESLIVTRRKQIIKRDYYRNLIKPQRGWCDNLIKLITRPKLIRFHKNVSFIKSYYLAIIKIYSGKILRKRFKKKKYNKRLIISENQGNEFLYEKIISGNYFLASRFGNSELTALMELEAKRSGVIKKVSYKGISPLFDTTGFYANTNEMLDQSLKYYDLITNNLKNIDALFTFDFSMEDYFYKKYFANNSIVSASKALEPFYFKEPWSRALKDKNVLIIHPFSETIVKQYKKRDILFENQNILPEFNLITYQTVQTIGGGYSGKETWFDLLENMINDIKNIDFDIALIGAGSYGMPLGFEIKKLNKQAIHIGGGLQLLFGIKGKRWDLNPVVSGFYNENWVYPSKIDTPKNLNNLKYDAYAYWK